MAAADLTVTLLEFIGLDLAVGCGSGSGDLLSVEQR